LLVRKGVKVPGGKANSAQRSHPQSTAGNGTALDSPILADTTASIAPEPAVGPLLLLLAGSGCAALIYEVVWFQLLEFTIGASGISLGLLLAVYMGGLALGSIAGARVIPQRILPLRIYAALEAGVGAFALLALVLIPLIGKVYATISPAGVAGIILRGIAAAVCLLPPTLLMGASLPAVSRCLRTTKQGVSSIGLLYSANIAGAVTGALFAGFYLLRVHDLTFATWVAVAINVVVAAGAWMLSAWSSVPEMESTPGPPSGVVLIYFMTAVSGLTALGGEVIWTRLLSLLLGATVYTFSIILAVFLAGMCVGSWAGSVVSRRVSNVCLALAVCQMLLAIAIGWTTFTLAHVLPWWPVDPALSISPWFNFDLDVTRCIRAILFPTLLWGASFPLALAAAARPGDDPARLSGFVYAANTLGSIVGALVFSLLMIPLIGTTNSQRVLVWLTSAGCIAAFLSTRGISRARMWTGATVAVSAAVLISSTIAPIPWQAIAYGRRIAPILQTASTQASGADSQPLFMGEGIDSSVVIIGRGDQRFFYVSGKSEASNAPIDMRLQRMMGHLPALLHKAPQSVLVVGFGAGVTAGSFVPYKVVRSITICELESLIPSASNEFFGRENNHVLEDGRTTLVHDDARHYVLTAPQKFDIITTDPIHPWVRGSSTLYTKQFYEMEKAHLNRGGIVAQWLPIYESDEQTVKTELATFFSVFPHGTVWSNYQEGDGYDLVLIGSEDSTPVDVDDLDRRLHQADFQGVLSSLMEVAFPSAVDLLSSYAGRADDLAAMVEGAVINEDSNLRLQYLAGSGVNSNQSQRIFRAIMQYRRFPEGLFSGTGERVDILRARLGRKFRTF
jgi:spermidine synthase